MIAPGSLYRFPGPWRGADFLTPPKQHKTELRCYMRDPDGYLIEVGQTTLPGGWRQFLGP
jgi:hypothetical protein